MLEKAAHFIRNHSVILLVSMYITGLIGYLVPAAAFIIPFTPINLILSTGIVLLHHKHFSLHAVWYMLFVCVYGYLIELVGVKTGLIFGTYYYEDTLGWKLWDTPLVMGVNWLMLMYISSSVVSTSKGSFWLKAIYAATLMVALDFLIEPVAMHYHFWQWEMGKVPLQNYIGWWLGAFVIQFFWHKWNFPENNTIAKWLFVLQALFFGLLNVAM